MFRWLSVLLLCCTFMLPTLAQDEKIDLRPGLKDGLFSKPPSGSKMTSTAPPPEEAPSEKPSQGGAFLFATCALLFAMLIICYPSRKQ